MTQREINRTLMELGRLNYESGEIDLVFRNGDCKGVYVKEVESNRRAYFLIYATNQEVDSRDWLPRVSLRDLEHIKVQKTGEKISLTPFQNKKF